MYKSIILLIMFTGILFVVIQGLNSYSASIKPQKKTEYRYIPRSFEEEQLDPIYVSEIFGESLFKNVSPWILSIREYDQKKQESINAYFINQL